MNDLKKIWNKFSKGSSFVNNLGITTLGNSLGYLIGFVFTPFIARIYPPESYGTFAVFNALALNLSLIVTLNYSNALILPKKEIDLVRIFQLILILLFINVVVLQFILIIWGNDILNLFNLKSLGDLIYLLPFFVFLTGLNQSFISLSNKLADFKKFSTAKVISMVSSKGFTLGYGLIFSNSPVGLIMGELLLKPLNILFIVSQKSKRIIRQFSEFEIAKVYSIAKTYINYPKFYMPGSWLGILISQIPLYFLSYQFEASYSGHYAFANSLLNIPVIIFSQSLASVYIQRASELYPQELSQLKVLTEKLLKKVFIPALLVYGTIFGFGDYIFLLILGESWDVAGEFAKVLSIGFIFYAIAVPFQTLFRILKEEKTYLYFNLIVVVFLLTLFLASELIANVHNIILYYSILLGFYSLVSTVYVLKKLRIKNIIPLVLQFLGIIFILFLLFRLMRYFLDIFL